MHVDHLSKVLHAHAAVDELMNDLLERQFLILGIPQLSIIVIFPLCYVDKYFKTWFHWLFDRFCLLGYQLF